MRKELNVLLWEDVLGKLVNARKTETIGRKGCAAKSAYVTTLLQSIHLNARK